MAPATRKADTACDMPKATPPSPLLALAALSVSLAAALAATAAQADAPAPSTAPTAPPPGAPAAPPKVAATLPPLPALDRMLLAKMRAGRVIALAEESAGEQSAASGAVRGWAICKCKLDAAWEVLTDHSRFPEFVPRVEKMEISRRTATGERAAQTIDASISTLRYALDYAWDRATGTIEFHLVEEVPHDLKAVTGGWQLWPLDGGAATLFEYRSSVDAGRAIPGFIRSYLADRGVKDTLEAVRKRAESHLTAR